MELDLGLSLVALVVAVAVALWQWRVMRELRAIHYELQRLGGTDGRADPVP